MHAKIRTGGADPDDRWAGMQDQSDKRTRQDTLACGLGRPKASRERRQATRRWAELIRVANQVHTTLAFSTRPIGRKTICFFHSGIRRSLLFGPTSFFRRVGRCPTGQLIHHRSPRLWSVAEQRPRPGAPVGNDRVHATWRIPLSGSDPTRPLGVAGPSRQASRCSSRNL